MILKKSIATVCSADKSKDDNKTSDSPDNETKPSEESTKMPMTEKGEQPTKMPTTMPTKMPTKGQKGSGYFNIIIKAAY